MDGLSPYGQVLPLVIAMLVVVAAVVGFGLKARAGRLRRARAVLDAEAHVVETPPAVPEKPEPAASDGDDEQTSGRDAEQPVSAGVGDTTTGTNGERPGVGPAGERQEERRKPEPPVTGADSALAELDVGRFTSSLSPMAGRRRRLMPVPRVAAEEPEPEPPYPGAVAARPDGSSPSSEYRIKANLAVKRYYTHNSPYFARTTAQVWFRTVEDAERAGFTSAGG